MTLLRHHAVLGYIFVAGGGRTKADGRPVVRAVLFPGNGAVTTTEKVVGDPKAGQVLIALRAAGVCGSDLHFMNMSPDSNGTLPRQRLRPRPRGYAGHEIAGVWRQSVLACPPPGWVAYRGPALLGLRAMPSLSHGVGLPMRGQGSLYARAGWRVPGQAARRSEGLRAPAGRRDLYHRGIYCLRCWDLIPSPQAR